MITLYTWSTPNGKKISVMLEECGLRYEVKPINIGNGDQFTPDFVSISPNSKIPAIVDTQGPEGKPIALFESGAILIYLAEKCARYLPTAAGSRYTALQWLMFQMSGIGPMFGQAHHFLRFAPEQVPYAMNRYRNETRRLYGVLEARLQDHEYLADEYSIADMATFPWVARHDWQQIDLVEFPAVHRWFAAISVRPAVQRGMAVPS